MEINSNDYESTAQIKFEYLSQQSLSFDDISTNQYYNNEVGMINNSNSNENDIYNRHGNYNQINKFEYCYGSNDFLKKQNDYSYYYNNCPNKNYVNYDNNRNNINGNYGHWSYNNNSNYGYKFPTNEAWERENYKRQQKQQELHSGSLQRQQSHCLATNNNNVNLHSNNTTSNSISISNNTNVNTSILHNKISPSDPLDALKTLTVQAGQTNLSQIIGRNQSTNISHPTNQNLSNIQSSDLSGQSTASMKNTNICNKSNLSGQRMPTSIPPNTNSSASSLSSSIIPDGYPSSSSLSLPLSTVSSASVMTSNLNSRPISNSGNNAMNPLVYGNTGMHPQRQASAGSYMPMNHQQYHPHHQMGIHPHHHHIPQQHMSHHSQQQTMQQMYHHHHHNPQQHPINRISSGGGGGGGGSSSHMGGYVRPTLPHQTRQQMYHPHHPDGAKRMGHASSNCVSEEVAEAVRRLREKYCVSLRSAQEKVAAQQAINNSSESGKKDDSRVLDMIQKILDDPSSLTKPLSMDQIPKIEMHLQNAERLANEGNITKVQQPLGGIAKPDQSKSVSTPRETNPSPSIMQAANSNNNKSLTNQPASANQSLDAAFNTVCSELISMSNEASKRKSSSENEASNATSNKKSMQQTLFEHVRSKIPKLESQIPMPDDYKYEVDRKEEKFDPREFDSEPTQPSVQQFLLDASMKNTRSSWDRSIDEPFDSVSLWYSQFNSRSKIEYDWWDRNGMLRVDLDPEMDEFESLDFDTEMSKLQSEFKTELLDKSDNIIDLNQLESKDNKTDDEGIKSGINSKMFKEFNGTIRFKLSYLDKNPSKESSSESLPAATMPTVIITVDSDYTDSGIIKTWKLQPPELLLDQQQTSPHHMFSQLVSTITQKNFRVHSLARQWDGLCLTHVAYILKISILTAAYRFSIS